MSTPEDTPPGAITRLLEDARAGKPGAKDRLFALIYPTLRDMARARISAYRAGRKLDATELVHAAYIRLCSQERLDADGHLQLFYIFLRAMGDVLGELFRANDALKRGGGLQQVPLIEFSVADDDQTVPFDELHAALEELRKRYPGVALFVMFRYFYGFTLDECVEVMGQSLHTVRGYGDYAKAWLADWLSGRRRP